MTAWFSRLFRSRTETLAEKAEVEGRFDDAARLYVETGARDEAFRVLMRAAESAKHLADRRGYVARAYGIARDDAQKKTARRALGLVTLAEVEAAPTQSDEERMRLAEAAADLEAASAFREAARAFKLLNDREAVERMLMLSGDVEGYEREAGADADEERLRLRRRNAIESFEAMWRSGDRSAAVQVLEAWVREHERDGEARTLLESRRSALTSAGRFEAVINGVHHVVVGALPATLGREGTVVLRGASVSREHAVIERGEQGALYVRDNGSRNGTQLESLPLAGAVQLAQGQAISLGADMSLRVRDCYSDSVVLEVERGMDRGRRAVFVSRAWASPLGPVEFVDGRAVLSPAGAVRLSGQRVIAPIALARGDRVEGQGVSLEVLR